MKIKLSEWAAKNGIKYRTAWKWVKAGKMPENAKVWVMPTGTILIEEI
jgi:putative resolvase